MNAPRAIWLVSFEGVDVSDELAPMATSITYTDNEKDASDELALECEDRNGRWRGGWFPSEGDRITLKLGWEGERLLDCGSFKVDEVELSGVDTVSIRALAAQSLQPVRTVQHRAFELTTLDAILRSLAKELQLDFIGNVDEIPVLRATQQETTVAFMRRLAERYGYSFSLRAERCEVFKLEVLDKSPPVLALSRHDLMPDYKFKSKAANTYAACELSYLDTSKQLHTVRVEERNARQRIVLGDASTGTPEPVPVPTRVLRQGITGDDVRNWQLFVRSKGIDPGPIDGIFGPKTRAGTMNFQKGAGLKVDGVVGPETMRAAVAAGYGTTTTGEGTGTRAETAGNVLRITRRAESVDDAERQARAALAAANRLKVTGSISVIGRPKLVAGATFELSDMGRISGKFKATKSTHKVDRSGAYMTSAEVIGV